MRTDSELLEHRRRFLGYTMTFSAPTRTTADDLTSVEDAATSTMAESCALRISAEADIASERSSVRVTWTEAIGYGTEDGGADSRPNPRYRTRGAYAKS